MCIQHCVADKLISMNQTEENRGKLTGNAFAIGAFGP